MRRGELPLPAVVRGPRGFQLFSIDSPTIKVRYWLKIEATTTAVATGGLTVYAFRTKRDFTRWGGMLSAGLGGLLVLMLMQFLFGASSLVRMAQSYFTALLFSGYLLYNTQLMMGGDKSRQVRPDEWLLAAVSIYTDVINLFMAILEIMNSQEQRR